ncbi:MAG: RNA methyltransferase [Candidatus Paceibacteria bacterium]
MKEQRLPRNDKTRKLIVILDNIRSAHNVGSIFRTGDAMGISKIYLCGITPAPDATGRAARDIAKTALGAQNYIPWEKRSSTWRLLEELREKGFSIVALEQHKSAKNIRKFKPKFPLALIVGNEVNGLSPNILKRADALIYIPMYGKKESLNVAVACGIALFALRTR